MAYPIPLETKLEAARLYVLTGSASATEKKLGLGGSTVLNWLDTDWFQEEVEKTKAEITSQHKAKLRTLIDSALDEAQDRLANGEQVLSKNGNTVSVPVRARDCALIATMSIDRLRLLEGRPTKITASLDALGDLAQAFAQAAAQYRAKDVVATQGPPDPLHKP